MDGGTSSDPYCKVAITIHWQPIYFFLSSCTANTISRWPWEKRSTEARPSTTRWIQNGGRVWTSTGEYQTQTNGWSLLLAGTRSLTTSLTLPCLTTTRWGRTTGWVGWKLTCGSLVGRWTSLTILFSVLVPALVSVRVLVWVSWYITQTTRSVTTFGGQSRRGKAN